MHKMDVIIFKNGNKEIIIIEGLHHFDTSFEQLSILVGLALLKTITSACNIQSEFLVGQNFCNKVSL